VPTMTTPPSLNPKVIAKLGEDIYKQKYQAEYEASHHGKFVAINVRSADAAIGDTPEEAFEKAKAADASGLFHLIRVGFPSAFQASHAYESENGKSNSDWIFG
jgi:hypothetical protein